ncbi:hypothetical protein Tco_0556153 [Tanacetum coccineum]
MRQEEAGLEEAIKLQAQLDEEVARQIHLDKLVAKRMAEEEALTEQQKKRKAQLEANAELAKDVLGKDLPEQDFAKRMVEMMNQRKKHFAEERAKAKRNKPQCCVVLIDPTIISVDDLKTDSENDNDKVNMPSFLSSEPTVCYFDDLDFLKDFEKEFLAISYNNALTTKLDFLTEPTISSQHIDEFDLKDETSLSEYDGEEQNILYFNDLIPFNVIFLDDSKSDKDNNDDQIDINQPSGGNVINIDDGAYCNTPKIR